MKTTTFPFGSLIDGTAVNAIRLENAAGVSLTVLDYGAAIQSLCVPDRDGRLTDVVLGYDTAAEYEQNDFFFGATIGRVGNRIGGASFTLNGKTYNLAKNDGENHLHGGIRGFDKRMWHMTVKDDCILCDLFSPDGEEGYPGNLRVRVTFCLTQDGTVRIEYDADTDADTPVNLTNHSYFNLDGSDRILQHRLQIFADRFCEGDAGCLPTGRLLNVEGTPFDFRSEKEIGRDIDADDEQLRFAGGYDHNYCLSEKRSAVLYSEKTGIEMTMNTDRPGVQFYSGNFLREHTGKGGRTICHRGALCLETQLYPNGMACPGFPSPVLKAGQHLHTWTEYSFRIR